MELFKTMAAVDIVHIPYKGATPALTDLLGGQISLVLSSIVLAQPLVKTGKLRDLAVTGRIGCNIYRCGNGRVRGGALPIQTSSPDRPVREAGIPGVEANVNFALLAPAATPNDIITRLNGEIGKALRLPEVRERMLGQGAVPVGNSAAEATRFLDGEIARWGRATKALGLHLD
ncbi:MAG: hypothetical protein K2Y16_07735 [Burkholderiales bacterium]|nr:hypothetical protein [Burkholderiales bacterium]